MYIQYFGLRENPFALPPDPRYLYLGLRHQEALAHLMYGITEGGGFVQLTGEVGTGKTMMIRALLERLPKNVNVALVLYPFLSVREFIAAVCDDLGVTLPPGDSLKAMIDVLNAYLLETHAQGRRTVLVVDEAHKLSLEVLEQIRLLTNLETTKEKLLQIILVGQPELNQLLARQDLRQLAQRITARYNLKALLWEESCEYVLHRCRVAGAQMPLFNRSALRAIFRLAGGIPRVINVLCDRALLGAYSVGKPKVNAALVRKAVTEVGPDVSVMQRRWWIPLTAAAATVSLLAFTTWHFWPVIQKATIAATDAVAATAPKDEVPKIAQKQIVFPPSEMDTVAALPPGPSQEPSLEKLLADENIPTDTDTAFTRLFAYWQHDYAQFNGATGCDRAQQAGLRCLFESGTWNNLRQLNRPAIIELTDSSGARHHVLITALKEDSVSLELGDRLREVPLSDVNQFWYGKFLSLWKPPESGDQLLIRGMRSPAIVWLRDALARANVPVAQTAEQADIFDADLEAKVKEFQRRHQIEDDGLVGQMTLVLLTNYDKASPPLLANSETVTAR